MLVTSVCAYGAEGKHSVLNPARLSYLLVPYRMSTTHMPLSTIPHTDSMILRVPAWRPGRVRQVPILRASLWRGLYFAVQIHLRSLSDSDDIGIPCECAGHVCVALQVLVVRYVACGMNVMHLNVASIM